jgi:hypothetical protein
MKFDLKYPDKANAQKVYPDKLMGPHEEVWISENFAQTWRMYPCSVCGARTGWREVGADYSVPLCSEECAAEFARVEPELPS